MESQQPTKILIIEDEVALSDVLQKKLEKEGYRVFVACDGEEGLAQIEAVKPDLILLDVVMPKINGMEVLERMRQSEPMSRIPVVIISNSGEPVEIDRALALGAKDYIIKTEFDPKEVLEKMAKILPK